MNNRYDIAYLFDITNGNPNGDPDAGNLPRVDPETGIGLVSDVCLKRKIRNYVDLVHGGKQGHHIYVQEDAILSDRHKEAYKNQRPGEKEDIDKANKLTPKEGEEAALQKFMCENFWDIRTFGAMMSIDINIPQVRGPVQIGFARSVEPIRPLEISITRCAASNREDLETRRQKRASSGNADDVRVDRQTMGNKYIVPYGLYCAHIYINAPLAKKTGFGEGDRDLFFDALREMFEHDRSSARAEMNARKIVAFKHSSELGNARSHALFGRVKVQRRLTNETVPLSDPRLEEKPARAYEDYEVTVDRDGLPEGVEIIEHTL